MLVCHASDWHGSQLAQLPAADLYVFSGDMLPNFVWVALYSDRHELGYEWYGTNDELAGLPAKPRPEGRFLGRRVDHGRERECQELYLERMGHGYARGWLGSPDAPVIVCRGNHDFTDLAPMFGGRVHEVGTDPTRAFELGVGGGVLRVGGARGINEVSPDREWSDELRPEELDDRFRSLPADLDVLVTHAPPAGVLDSNGHSLGVQALRRYVDGRSLCGGSGHPLRAHLFGHIHEALGTLNAGGTVFSNAATGWLLLEL